MPLLEQLEPSLRELVSSPAVLLSMLAGSRTDEAFLRLGWHMLQMLPDQIELDRNAGAGFTSSQDTVRWHFNSGRFMQCHLLTLLQFGGASGAREPRCKVVL